ncbi:MAG: hypothetical protein K0R71_781 [Bacillales bacterium]|jgi:hypothetical protein|nr:hypothetical protein [Bacillales bacterium]
MRSHRGYQTHDPKEKETANSYTEKTVRTSDGELISTYQGIVKQALNHN